MNSYLKLIVLIILVVGVSGCASTLDKSSEDFNRAKNESMILACERLVHHYPSPRDAVDAAAYGQMFTDDAKFTFGGKVTVGRENIVNNLLKRGPQQVTRHLTGSVSIEPINDFTARGISYALVLRASPSEPFPKSMTPDSYLGFARYLDLYSYQAGVCRFQEREVYVDFLNKSSK